LLSLRYFVINVESVHLISTANHYTHWRKGREIIVTLSTKTQDSWLLSFLESKCQELSGGPAKDVRLPYFPGLTAPGSQGLKLQLLSFLCWFLQLLSPQRLP
jgi:hypothetical protein